MPVWIADADNVLSMWSTSFAVTSDCSSCIHL